MGHPCIIESRRGWKLVVTLLFVVTIFSPVSLRSTRAATNAGQRDFAFASPADAWNIDSSPTATKPQSKLWFNDGTWWGSLEGKSTGQFHIYRFNMSDQSWTDTGTVIDDRATSHADCLWDGSHLYVATAVPPGSSGDKSIRLLRYSYDSGSHVYTKDSGYPVTIASSGIEAVVLDKDSTGRLWVTYTDDNGNGGRSVYVAHSDTSGTNWITPFVIPATGAGNLTSDDISAIVAFDGKVGVMWSNQNDSSMYFASHVDGAADDQWTQNPALQGPGYADDHINLKSLQSDANGRVYAAVKTSLNDGSSGSSGKPQILLLVLDAHGSWSRATFGRVSDNHTRPIVLIDQEHSELYMFATAPPTPGGTIYYKKTALDNISFPTGLGTPFIQSGTDPNINNATSTKQTLNSNTGLLVVASDLSTGYYLHHYLDLGGTTPPPTTCSSGQFQADYFNNETLSGSPTFTQCESAPVNHNWGKGGPGNGVGTDSFSARFTGDFTFSAGDYTFTATADDGVRIFLDGTKILDGWKNQAPTTYTNTVTVTAGSHTVVVEYYEHAGGAVVQADWNTTSSPPPTGCASGQFQADYFNNETLSGSPTFTQCESAPVNHNWGKGGPGNGVGTDSFSARFTGDFTFSAGDYTFTATADDGVRIFLDGTKILDGWKNQAPTTYSNTVTVTAGSHTVVVEYYEHAGGAVVQADWNTTSSPPPTGCASGQFQADYFNNETLSGSPTFTQCESAPVNHNWGKGGPGNGVGTDSFSARFTGDFTFSAGDYTFTATADDGVRIFLDGTKILDGWKNQAPTTYSNTVTVTAGSHTVVVEYYEHAGGAVVQADWSQNTP